MKRKQGVLQIGPMVRRVIYLSREANKALNESVKMLPYTPGEYVELLVLEEFEKLTKASTIAQKLIKKAKNPR